MSPSNEPNHPNQFDPTDLQPDAMSLNGSVRHALNRYFSHLEGQDPINLYDLFIHEVERPLLEAVMIYTHGNQTRAAALLGLNRATLRRKLKFYHLWNVF